MIGIHDFLIELKEDFSDTFKTESGLELYANKNISGERLSNRIATVINTPLMHETKIKIGYQVMIDPSILYKQIYRGVEQNSIHLVDEGKYKLTPKEIILYREDENSEWKGYLENNLVELIYKISEKLESSLIYIPNSDVKKLKKGRAKALYMNDSIDAKKGDELIINPNGGLSYWIDGKEHWWIRNIDIYGVAI